MLSRAARSVPPCINQGYRCRPTSLYKAPFAVHSRLYRAASTRHLKPLPKYSLLDDGVRVKWDDGEDISLGSLFLRDHCACPDCQNVQTRQRKVDAFAVRTRTSKSRDDILPEDIKPLGAQSRLGGLVVTWNDDDRHESFYSWQWLRACTAAEPSPTELFHLRRQEEFFSPIEHKTLPSIPYADIMSSDEGVRKWTDLICRFGFSFVDGCPVDPKSTEDLLKRISHVRHTHYGGFYDFTSDLALKDTAYTSEALDVHTDTTYFSDPAGLQMFHLLSHTEGEGGESLLVDGFRAAKQLEVTCPESFKTLTKEKIPWHASGNEGISISPTLGNFPVIQTVPPNLIEDHDGEKDGSEDAFIYQIRWNNSDRGTTRCAMNDHGSWYNAARKWRNILISPELEHRFQLEPGKPLIFDNWRILHGRAGFTGARRMCGGYISMDDFVSRWKNLNIGRDELLELI